MMTKLVLVAGTWDGNPPWIEDPFSPFRTQMTRGGFVLATGKDGLPFRWPTMLSGIPFRGVSAWEEHGARLAEFLMRLPYSDRNVIALSHGGQLAIYAAVCGHRVRSLTTVGTPRRADVPAEQAVGNIDYWQHICDEKLDLIGVGRRLGGQLFDRIVSTERRFLIPGVRNITVKGIGHSDVLKKAEFTPLWQTEGWFANIRRNPNGPIAA